MTKKRSWRLLVKNLFQCTHTRNYRIEQVQRLLDSLTESLQSNESQIVEILTLRDSRKGWWLLCSKYQTLYEFCQEINATSCVQVTLTKFVWSVNNSVDSSFFLTNSILLWQVSLMHWNASRNKVSGHVFKKCIVEICQNSLK